MPTPSTSSPATKLLRVDMVNVRGPFATSQEACDAALAKIRTAASRWRRGTRSLACTDKMPSTKCLDSDTFDAAYPSAQVVAHCATRRFRPTS